MIRIRNARQAYEEIKRNDPESCISERQIRDILSSGVIPIIRRGNRKYVNMDVLEAYFSDPTTFSA